MSDFSSAYFVAGKANDPFLAACQHVADALAANLSTFSVSYDIQHPEDWDNYLDDLCASRGFTHRSSPVVSGDPVSVGDRTSWRASGLRTICGSCSR
jgi:hypothetical protein